MVGLKETVERDILGRTVLPVCAVLLVKTRVNAVRRLGH